MALSTSSIPRTLAIWIMLAVLSGLAALAAWRWTVTAADGVTHTLLVQQELSNWLSAVQDLETGQRGYLLTHNPQYLEPYQSARKSLDSIHEVLTSLVGDSPQQLATIQEINKTLQERLAVIDKNLAEIDTGRSGAPAGQAAGNGLGMQIMDRLRHQISTAKKQEKSLFAKRLDQFKSRSFWLLAAMLSTLLASAGLAMIALIHERQRAAALELTALTLSTTNRALEKHVEARTEELAIERDRAEAERERAEALLRDVTHRIGNTLALVVGFINLHIRHTTDPISVRTLTGARDRIHAIASAQRRINVVNDLELVRIDTLIQAVMADVVAAAAEDRIALNVEIPPLLAPAQVATSLCVLTQEFVVNSLKHAFEGETEGIINVRMRKEGDNGAELVIEDNGKGWLHRQPTDLDETEIEGLGTKIANMLTRQFSGSISYDSAFEGAARPGTRVTVHLTELTLSAALQEDPDNQKSRSSG
ncbi:signal transduction histidine kinase [Hyphomicrobium denitrificans 1NES1]|uniref:histidine kinase n=1 Tax=Hyphomicrobium denitrificans 1NES1 TaxID=670307 RepID=N0B7U8_9HYPH|nr:CHASE3 domain-containing protein [Hyphomicrobium denitrificans]AGK59083.1 signal transduction histidine kinase [Hyphomicrobium denitrificans 1NES1]